MLISLERIRAAASPAGGIDPIFLNSPQITCEGLAKEIGVARLTLKVETLNPIRSFKGRGSSYYVHHLGNNQPIVAASAGNFGQGLAYACRQRGIPLHLFAAERANPLKVERMRKFGAQVVLGGVDFDDAKVRARAFAAANNLRFVEDGLDAPIAEGAGTIAVELLGSAATPFDAVVIPVGNGSLICGMAAWIKAKSPGTRVVGVCASAAPCMQLSWLSGTPVSTATAHTIADGIGVRTPVPQAVTATRELVDEMLLVDEGTLAEAMRAITLDTGILPEPSGAAGVAALIAHRGRFAGQTIATVLCGANNAVDHVRRLLQAL